MSAVPSVEAIFHAALEKPAAGERAAYLDDACAGEAALRERVETLLRAHDQAAGFLNLATVDPPAAREGPGDTIGRYKLLQEIGEGGFGTVYMAEQQEPVRRKVALKIIKLGMDTRQVVARFEAERQALALMEHANIARVFDAGATAAGRPYFVMELVRGVPITEYCDQNHLTTRERLGLFVAVCQAVQHAHQKGIIHRDIKPNNVLVTLHDGRPVPKVIDFGIAKATHQRLTEKTLFTEFRQFIGTPEYMSPEQAEMSGLDIDTRSDVYSLGVLLYELLTGGTPFDSKSLRRAAYDEMQRMIREQEPVVPSTRLESLGDNLTAIAKHRRCDPRLLSKLVRGDLDWIVMKALEKDRSRRYDTAAGLADDVERHLANQPVLAGPPSVLYQARKFVRRHRGAAVVGAAATLALCAGLAVATVGFVQASRERDAARDAQVRADREAARAQEMSDFLQELFASVDIGSGESVDPQQVLDKARKMFGGDHLAVAAVLDSAAVRLQHSGNLEAAEPLFEEALAIWRKQDRGNRARTIATLGRLGALLAARRDLAGAEQTFREALELSEAASSPSGSTADVQVALAELLMPRGEYQEAEQLLRDAVRIRRSVAPQQAEPIALALDKLTQALILQNKQDEADPVFRETIAAYAQVYPADSAYMAQINVMYGMWLRQSGRGDEARPLFEESLAIYAGMQDPPREFMLLAQDGLFQVLFSDEATQDQALAMFDDILANFRKLFGPDDARIADQCFGVGRLYEQRDQPAKAIRCYLEADRIYRLKRSDWSAEGTSKVLSSAVWDVLRRADRSQEDYETALVAAKTCLELLPGDARWLRNVGGLEYRLGRLDEAVAALEQTKSQDRRPTADALLAMAYSRLDRAEDARAALARARDGLVDVEPKERPEVSALVDEAAGLVEP